MKFEYVWKLLHLIWIVPLFALIVYMAAVKRKNIFRMIFGRNADISKNTTLAVGKRYFRLWLLFSAIVLCVIAIARPQWGWRNLPFTDRGRDIMVVFDVSKSMNAEDVKPCRLKHAKLLLRNIVKSNPSDRFGLIAFAGTAFLECPLTVDKTSFFQCLDELSTDSIPLGGTNIQVALENALKGFKAAAGGFRAVLLITDGDELSGDSSQVISELKKMKIPIFVVGVGKPGGDGLIKMHGENGNTYLLRDAQGNLAKAKLNETNLRRLAASTPGGLYVRSTETNPELKILNSYIRKLVPKEYMRGMSRRPVERFHYPLAAAVLLILIWFAVGERRRIVVSFLVALFLSAGVLSPTAPAKDKQPSNINTAPLVKNKESKNTAKKEPTPADIYNKALALQKQNKIEKAQELYRDAINMSKADAEIRSRAFQNIGVIYHQNARKIITQDPDKALAILNKAETMYRESMRTNLFRKRVVLNQQKLLDDRLLAKRIKKMREELKKKQEQARKKVEEAKKSQEKENKQKQNNKSQQKKKDTQKNRQKQNNDKKQKQSGQNKQNKQTNKQKNTNNNQTTRQNQSTNKKQNQQKNQNDNQNNESNKTEQKIKEAASACKDLKKKAEQAKKQNIKKQADNAEKELRKAQEEHKKGNGKESEKHINKALQYLNPQKNNQKKQSQNKNNSNNGKKNPPRKNKSNKGQQNKQKKMNQPQQKQKSAKAGKAEKPLDPRQAAALLEMMSNDEKTLRDKIKENMKRNARLKKVLKDW